jgi:hypothetical protein
MPWRIERFVSAALNHGQSGIFGKGWISLRPLAEIEFRAPVRRDQVHVPTIGAQANHPCLFSDFAQVMVGAIGFEPMTSTV